MTFSLYTKIGGKKKKSSTPSHPKNTTEYINKLICSFYVALQAMDSVPMNLNGSALLTLILNAQRFEYMQVREVTKSNKSSKISFPSQVFLL